MDQIQFKTLDEFIRLFHKKVSSFTNSEMVIQLQHLAHMLSQKQIQTEAKNDCFFKRWSEIKLPISLITIDFISQLFVIYTKVNDILKEDIFIQKNIIQFNENQKIYSLFFIRDINTFHYYFFKLSNLILIQGNQIFDYIFINKKNILLIRQYYLYFIIIQINFYLQQQILQDFIWPLIVYEFEEKKVVIEYFNIMKTIYNKKYRDLLKCFGIFEMVKFMLKTTEIDEMICCEQHNNKDQPKQIISQETQVKIDQFGLLINEILHQIVNDLSQATGSNLNELEQLFALSIHQMLSYCTKDHNLCQIQKLLIILISQLPKVNEKVIQKVFQNFESISFIQLYNSTTSQVLQIYCVKLFQIISNNNPQVPQIYIKQILQQLILSIIPSSKNKKFVQNLDFEPLICSILEWLLNIPISIKITEYQMFDEKLTFRNHDVMELVLNYLYICHVMMKQQLITTLYTLTRNNKENQLFLLSNKHFLCTFPKFLMGLQDQELLDIDEDQNSLSKSVQIFINARYMIHYIYNENFKIIKQLQNINTSLKLISTVFMNQLQNGKIDMLFQWLKLVELEQIKQKNDDLDGFKDARTPIQFIRQMITYIFNNLLKSSILNTSQLTNEQLWKGFHLFIAAFLAIISKDLIQQDFKISKLVGKKVLQSPQILMIIQMFQNSQWIDYQFCSKIVQIVNFLYSQTISMNLDIIKPSINFKCSEFVIWLNQLFKKILSNEKDNIFLMRIIQTLICYYQHYIVTQNFGQQQLEEIQQLLKAYRHLMQSLICGSQQFKNLKHIPMDTEQQITLSHYFYIESQMKLINQIKQKLQKDHHASHDSFFNLYALQELIAYIQQQLQEYYSGQQNISDKILDFYIQIKQLSLSQIILIIYINSKICCQNLKKFLK